MYLSRKIEYYFTRMIPVWYRNVIWRSKPNNCYWIKQEMNHQPGELVWAWPWGWSRSVGEGGEWGCCDVDRDIQDEPAGRAHQEVCACCCGSLQVYVNLYLFVSIHITCGWHAAATSVMFYIASREVKFTLHWINNTNPFQQTRSILDFEI